MKRNEMLDNIANVIASFKGFHEPSRNDLYVANKILKTIEELGMLPPRTLITDKPDLIYGHKWDKEE